MTWDQFAALVLGLVATALIRLLDKYLPATTDHPVLEQAAQGAGEPSELPPDGTSPSEAP